MLSATETITEPSVWHHSSSRLNGLMLQVNSNGTLILEGPVVCSYRDRAYSRYEFAFITCRSSASIIIKDLHSIRPIHNDDDARVGP